MASDIPVNMQQVDGVMARPRFEQSSSIAVLFSAFAMASTWLILLKFFYSAHPVSHMARRASQASSDTFGVILRKRWRAYGLPAQVERHLAKYALIKARRREFDTAVMCLLLDVSHRRLLGMVA